MLHPEDPLIGDVDPSGGYYEPTEAERDMAEKYPLEAWSEEASENYWAEYDELHADDEPDTVDPRGVDHGPYPKTAEHPYDQSNGVHGAIAKALEAGRIHTTQADILDANARSLDYQEADEAQDIEHNELLAEAEAEMERENEERLEQERLENEERYRGEEDDPRGDWDGREDQDYEDEDEDPLAGDVERTGGYHED